MLQSIFKSKEIEFLCAEEDYGLIPAPYPAKKEIPDWFKALPTKLGNGGFNTSTVKRCNPFLDALCVGYIIPLAADVEFMTNDDASGVSFQWKFHKTMVETHGPDQISSDKCPHPSVPKPPMKFLNYWMIKVPPEYSLLFVPPLNRTEKRFTIFSGIVDAPYPEREYVNFPFTFEQSGFSGIIPAGTPLAQVIPIRKDALLPKYRSRVFTANDIVETQKMRNRRDKVHESLYRDNLHKKI